MNGTVTKGSESKIKIKELGEVKVSPNQSSSGNLTAAEQAAFNPNKELVYGSVLDIYYEQEMQKLASNRYARFVILR